MQHPDEGTIHAWLDGALGSDEARALEAHLAGCAQCTAAVTEARGLLAASSRILSALDSVPGGVLPATGADSAGDERVVAIGRSSRWRSPGLRAAAAIVVVGSVSWLATRSVQRAEDRTPVLRGTVATAAYETAPAAAKPAQAQADTSVQLAQEGATAARSRAAIQTSSPKPGRAQVVAAPQAMAFATTRPAAMPNAGVVGSSAGAQAKVAAPIAAAAASPVAPAPYASAEVSGNSLREESRVADAAPSAMRVAAAQARMKSSAAGVGASSAPSLLQAQSPPDSAVERLAGCYYIENAASNSATPTISAAAGLIPAQVQLLRDRDPSRGGNWRILRPAPGAPPFRLAANTRWVMLTADSVRLELQEGMQEVSARFGMRGDSIHGYALVSVPQLPGGEMGTGIRGSRIPCSVP